MHHEANSDRLCGDQVTVTKLNACLRKLFPSLSDLQIILSLLGTWFINQNPTDKSGKKIIIFSHNRSKNFQNPF